MSDVELVCPQCKESLNHTNISVECSKCAVTYRIIEGIPVLIPPSIDQLSSDEAKYHDEFIEDPVEVHQLNTLRNQYYHRLIQEEVLKEGECFLEVGGGSGNDSRELLKKSRIHLVETDISSQTLLRSRQILKDETNQGGRIQFVCCAITALPFPDRSFDATFCIAAIHHLSDVVEGLKELSRVSIENGRVILGLEPNQFYFRTLKRFRGRLCKMTHTSEENVSHADAIMEGFSEKELRDYCHTAGLRVTKIVPAWFTLGILHYMLEFAFRVFRLTKRKRVPRFIESAFLYFDRFLFAIPKFKYFCWHWIVFTVRDK